MQRQRERRGKLEDRFSLFRRSSSSGNARGTVAASAFKNEKRQGSASVKWDDTLCCKGGGEESRCGVLDSELHLNRLEANAKCGLFRMLTAPGQVRCYFFRGGA